MNNLVLIAMTEAKAAVEKTEGGLVEKLEASMRAVSNHWMVTNKDEQFQAAIGAVMDFYGGESEEVRHIEWEIGNIKRINSVLNSASNGIQLDWETVIEESDEFESVGLINMWQEVNENA